MNHDEFRLWIESNDPPFVIRAQGGRAYRITDRAHVWLPPDYEGLACVVVKGKGVIVLRLASIESAQIEHDVAAAR